MAFLELSICIFSTSRTGVLLTFVCNDRMSDTTDKMKDTTYGILDELTGFINDTVKVSFWYL